MAVELFQISFSGQITEGADLNDVQSKIGGLLKVNEAQITRLFSGKPVIVKKGLDKQTAQTYVLAFKRSGAICLALSMSAIPVATQAASQPSTEVSKEPSDSKIASVATESTDEVENDIVKKPAVAETPHLTFNQSASVSAVGNHHGSNTRSGSGTAVKIGVLVVILAIIVLAVPFVMGIQAEAQFKASIAGLQNSSAAQSVPFDIKVDLVYQRGWFNSTAINTVTVLIPEQDDIVIVLNSDVRHGPILFEGKEKFGLASIETKIPLNEELEASVVKIWKDNLDPIRIRSFVDFVGNTMTEISVDGFSLSDDENNPTSSVTVSDLSVTVTLTDNFSKLLGTIDWDGLSVDIADSKFLMGKLTGHTEKIRLMDNLWLGDDELSIAGLSVNPGSNASVILGGDFTTVNLESLKFQAHSEVDSGNFVRGYTTITVDNIIVKDKSVASQIEFTIEVENLPAGPLQSITAKIAEYQNKNGTTNQQPDLETLQDDLAEILAAGPVVKISTLQADTEHGRVKANLEASIKVDDPSLIQNPILLLLAVNASSAISVPAPLIENTPFAVSVPSFQEQGYLILENGNLKTSIKFEQGQLTVNGKVFQR
ncbi:MAG: hypothetical protein ACI845_000266 [Gammaproteobacteria bacterium]|jgi:uncharacterized protein YdgA (DUF945 family)